MREPANPQPASEAEDSRRGSGRDSPVIIKLSWAQALMMVAGFAALVAGEIVLYLHLSGVTGWPDAYGIECRRKCWPTYLFHSPHLLQNGDANEIALFVLLWAVVWVPALVLLPISKRLRAKRRSI